MGKSQELYRRAKTIIPGGTQLLTKRPEMFLPEHWPAYYSKAKGCKVWDLDGKEYTDTSYMGIGANVLGYADEDVNKAVMQAVENGSMCTLNSPEEVELAELLLELHPWAKSVRYAKTGGEALAIAVRIARAYSGKDIVLFCGYHGWSDWYLSANLNEDTALDGHLLRGLEPAGVPRGLLGSVFPFEYNDEKTFCELLDKYRGRIGAVVMEAVRNVMPTDTFWTTIRKMTSEENIPLVVDEVSSGFRLACGGAHLVMDIEPDIAVFAKALSNGYPMAAIIGKQKFMDSAQDTFISSTYWTERTGLCAAIATIKKYRDNNVHLHLENIGKIVQGGWQQMAEKNGIDITVSGIYPLSHLEFNTDNALAIKTYFTQEMLKLGFLATNAFYASYSHKEEDIQKYIQAVDKVFGLIKKRIENNDLDDFLEGPVCQTGFQRLT